jgi:hypothetical protein
MFSGKQTQVMNLYGGRQAAVRRILCLVAAGAANCCFPFSSTSNVVLKLDYATIWAHMNDHKTTKIL